MTQWVEEHARGKTTMTELAEQINTLLSEHRQQPSLARGVERCSCGESKMGEPGWQRNHVTDLLMSVALESGRFL